MGKILAFVTIVFCSVGLYAQQPDSVKIANTNTKSGIKTAVDYLLKNKELLNIKLDTRFDYQGEFDKRKTEESSFKAQTLKVWLTGEIAPGVRYLVRQRLNKPQNPMERDNLSGATDMAYLELDAGKKWTFRIGKQATMFGAFEYDYNPADLYLNTIFNTDMDAYKTGVNVAYKAGKQLFNFQVINSDSPQFSTEKYKKKAFAGLFLWEGNLFNNLIKTRYGYGAYQHDGSKYYSWLTLGTQLNLNKFIAEADFYMGERNIDFSSVVPDAIGYRPVKEQDISLNLRYDLGKFKPILKGTWSKRKDQLTTGNYVIGGLQGGMEYYPFTDPLLKNLRFHAMYIYNRTNFNGAYNTMNGINQNTVIVGMRWLFKVM